MIDLRDSSIAEEGTLPGAQKNVGSRINNVNVAVDLIVNLFTVLTIDFKVFVVVELRKCQCHWSLTSSDMP